MSSTLLTLDGGIADVIVGKYDDSSTVGSTVVPTVVGVDVIFAVGLLSSSTTGSVGIGGMLFGVIRTGTRTVVVVGIRTGGAPRAMGDGCRGDTIAGVRSRIGTRVGDLRCTGVGAPATAIPVGRRTKVDVVGIGTTTIIGVVGDRLLGCSCKGYVGVLGNGIESTFCSLEDGLFVTVWMVGDGKDSPVGKNDDDGDGVGVTIVAFKAVGGLEVEVVILTVGAGKCESLSSSKIFVSLLLLPLFGWSRLLFVVVCIMSDTGLFWTFTSLLPLLPFLIVKLTITITKNINASDILTYRRFN